MYEGEKGGFYSIGLSSGQAVAAKTGAGGNIIIIRSKFAILMDFSYAFSVPDFAKHKTPPPPKTGTIYDWNANQE